MAHAAMPTYFLRGRTRITSMRFQKQTTPPPYLNKRDQYRMLAMVGLLMLIVIGINYTADPNNWRWFFNLGAEQPPVVEGELKELDLDDIDFQVKSDRIGSLPPETFIATADEPAPNVMFSPDDDIRQFPKELLAEIKDQQVKLLRREQPVLESLVSLVQSLDEQRIAEAADPEVGFRVINVEPDTYRGRLIHIEGTLRNFTPFPFGDPESIEDDLYQAWIFTSDSGNKPWMVLCAERPKDLKVSREMEIPVAASGYFFKRYGYPSQGGMNVAPLLVAKSLQVTIVPTPPQRTEDISWYVMIVLGIIATLFGIMIWVFYRSDQKFATSHLAEIAEARRDAPADAIAQLNNIAAVDETELFKQLSEQSAADEV